MFVKKLFYFLKNKYYRRAQFNSLSYWADRYKVHGEKFVLNINNTDAENVKITELQKNIINEHLKALHDPIEVKKALDFGCGSGRFTQFVANIINGYVVGVDLIDAFPRNAASKNIEFRIMSESKIPVESDYFDIIFICLVLGGIKEKSLKEVVKEIQRVSKNNATILVIENTSIKKNKPYWYYRSRKKYEKLLNFASLKFQECYYDQEEEISVWKGVVKKSIKYIVLTLNWIFWEVV